MAFAGPLRLTETDAIAAAATDSPPPHWLPTVLQRLAAGDTLLDCATDLGMDRGALWLTLAAHVSPREYAHVREQQGQALADKALAVARDATAADAQAKRLYVDTLKWAAGKLSQQYGDRLTVQQSGDIRITVVEDSDATSVRAATLASAEPLASLPEPADATPDAAPAILEEPDET